ncbi:MAG TPA: sulfatase [Planctomycetota bacterium]|nr:sulfatase [Planctomycetota bacterium]
MKRLIILPLAVCALARAADARPNIVFVIVDQWRAQAFGFAGDPNVKTPNLDRFEHESLHLVNAVAGTPVCSPTRASLLTGQRPLTHGVFLNDVPLNPDAISLPKTLAAAGYDTACIGKWHIDGHGRSNFIPIERRQGFDYWKVLECTHAYNNSPYFSNTAEKLKWDGYDALAQTQDAQAYIRDHSKSGKPFLLWLAWGPPHNPYPTAPEKFRALYTPKDIVLRPNVPSESAAQARRDLAGYYAHCSALDACFGELWQTLKDAGIEENTLIVFTSDHGDMLYSQNLQRKQKPYDESVRVPLLLHWPRAFAQKNVKLDAPFNSEDMMPTLLGLSGVAIPASVEGLDFSAYLRGGKDPSDGAALIRCPAPFGEWERRAGGREYRGIRTARFTFVRDLDGPWLLFDNEKDPYQQENLVGKPEHAALQSELDARLKQKLAAAHDDFRPAAEYIARWKYKVDANGTMPYTP